MWGRRSFCRVYVIQREFWTLFNEQKATSFGGVPYTYEMLDKLRFFMRKLPSLRTMTQAGGKLLPELHKKFAEYAQRERKRFIVMYGQSEATARMAWLPADKALEKCGAMGIAIPGGKFRLLDEKGQDITTPNIVGELLYEGRNVTMAMPSAVRILPKVMNAAVFFSRETWQNSIKTDSFILLDEKTLS